MNDEALATPYTTEHARFVERNAAGTVYIYIIRCALVLNVLVKGAARSGLILIRALERGEAQHHESTPWVDDLRSPLLGRVKLAQALDIRAASRNDLYADPDTVSCGKPDGRSGGGRPRIGISVQGFPWRFTLAGSPFVSVPVRPQRRGSH